jgi:hypothetical protein
MPYRPLPVGTLILVATLLVSGCVSHAPTSADPSTSVAGPGVAPTPMGDLPLPSSAVEAILPACGTCFEPSIAIDKEGRILVIPNSGSTMARSLDGGRTFHSIGGVPIPKGGPGNPGWDGVLSTGADGRIYYTNMWGGLESPGAITIQVASTDDGGDNWSPNVLIGPIETEHEPLGFVDRPWATAAADGTVYVSYFQVSQMIFFLPGLYQLPVRSPVSWTQNWISKSTDGGQTFEAFVPISLLTSRPMRPLDPVTGQMATDAEGRVYVPFYAHDGMSEPFAYVATSSDRGATFETVEVGPDAGGAFVTVDVDDAGGVWVTWASLGGDVFLSKSLDHGETWSDPMVLNVDAPGVGTPWIVATDRVHVAWYQQAGDGFELLVASMSAEGTPQVERRVVATLKGGPNPHFPEPAPMTDFAHMTVGPGGSLSTVWNDGEESPRFHVASWSERTV